MVRTLIFLFITQKDKDHQNSKRKGFMKFMFRRIKIPKVRLTTSIVLRAKCPIPGALVTGSILQVIEDFCKRKGGALRQPKVAVEYVCELSQRQLLHPF